MNDHKLNIALAGHANVGKSVIFNLLTGSHQHIGNWPGKTIAKAEGTLYYNGYTIDVIDLPGIYSLATYSLEELISRQYIISQYPDFIINIIDATNLERSLIFTLQLLELERPTVVALNMVDLIKAKGITIDHKKLAHLLGVPVVPVAAIYGQGLTELLDQGITLIGNKPNHQLRYGKEVEERVTALANSIPANELPYSKRALALKLLEQDEELTTLISQKYPNIATNAQEFNQELEEIHGHSSALVVAHERGNLVSQIVSQVMQVTPPQKISGNELLNNITGHRIWGYPVMVLILGLFFFTVFTFGNYFSTLLEQLFTRWQTSFQNLYGATPIANLLWSAGASLFSLLAIVFPYILPFYFLLFLLENWGYLARVTYLMDNLMHKLGIHGKACIPLLLGLGCNVTACLACRIMETQREKFITGFLATFVPCSAVTIIIIGLAGKYLGGEWIVGLYLLVILIIIALGKLGALIVPGEPTELIMEMPSYKCPKLKTISLLVWSRLKEFIYIAAPIVIVSGVIIEGLNLINWLPHINTLLRPITVQWLGLPATTGILLLFGILRKELILVMLATIIGTANFSQVLTPAQIFTLALVSMLYIPCIATVAALRTEFGWRKTLGITLFKILFAIGVSGVALRILQASKLLV